MIGVGLSDFQGIFKIPVLISITAVISSMLSYSLFMFNSIHILTSLDSIKVVTLFTGYIIYLIITLGICLIAYNVVIRELAYALFHKKSKQYKNNEYLDIYKMRDSAIKSKDLFLYNYSKDLITNYKENRNTNILYFLSIFYQTLIFILVKKGDLILPLKEQLQLPVDTIPKMSTLIIISIILHIIFFLFTLDPNEGKYTKKQ